MDKDELVKRGRLLVGMKCIEKEFAKKMVYQGIVRFGSARKWSNMENSKSNNKGQGDKNEGVFAIIDQDDKSTINKYTKRLKRALICEKRDNNLLALKSENVMDLPSYCFFSISDYDYNGDFKRNGMLSNMKVEVKKEYYNDFIKGRGITFAECDKLPDKDKPVLIIIKNLEKFLMNLKNSLKNLGIVESSIIADTVKYRDMNIDRFECIKNHPMEMFEKDNYFNYQKEYRLLINSKEYRRNKDIFEINIGSMKDYAYIYENYEELKNGTIVDLDVNLEILE